MVKQTVYKNTFLGRIFFAIGLFSFMFFVGFGLFEVSNRLNQHTQDNGERVTATIVKVITFSDTSYGASAWACEYKYVAEDGRIYLGSVGMFEHKSSAEKLIGKEVEIVIDGKGASYLVNEGRIPYTWGIISGCLFVLFVISVIINRKEKKKYRIAVKNGTWENK